MPKLNRIRIANVSYDGKYILDQLYDTYGGEHTLFNLANGSGKSVLVQMMMQPILPMHRIHDRRVDGYISKTSAPTYVILEWVMDNTLTPVYFLTGIAMCSVGQDETGSRVKYFTFTYKYDSASEYDIVNTPLIQQKEGGNQYMPYEEALRLLKSARDELRPLRCYTRDRGEDYKKDLQEHGVFTKEWELLARVNNREGGVDKVFEDCRSSDALLNKWILKTISDNAGKDTQNLQEMFLELLASYLEQEDRISEKDVLTDFLIDIGKLTGSLAELCGDMEELEKVERLLSGLCAYLENRVTEITGEKEACQRRIQAQQAEKRRIDYEKRSEEWHSADNDFRRRGEALGKIQAEEDERRELYHKARQDKLIMEAAGHLKKMREAEEHISALREQLENLKAKSADQETNNILFSLGAVYDGMLLQNEKDMERLREQIGNLENALKEFKELKGKLGGEEKALAKNSGVLENKSTAFKNYEETCYNKLGISIRRTLTEELDAEEIAEARSCLEERISRLSMCQEELISQQAVAAARKKELAAEENELRSNQLPIGILCKEKKTEIEEYKTALEELKRISKNRNLSPLADDVPVSLGVLRNQELQYKLEISNWEAQIAAQSDTLARFREHSLHNAPAFGALLSSHNIPYTTGEDYLKDFNGAEQKSMLERNPMLPFCFLVGKSDFERAVSLQYDEGIDRICPVLILEHADQDIAAGENSAVFTEFGQAMCFYNEKSFSPDTRDEFEQTLEAAVTELLRSRDKWRGDLECLQKDIVFLERFPYTGISGRKLDEELGVLEAERLKLLERLDANSHESQELEALLDGLQTEIPENAKRLKKSEDDLSLFEEYILRNAEYLAVVIDRRRIEEEIGQLGSRGREIDDHLEKCGVEKERTRIELNRIESLNTVTEEKRRKLTPPDEGALLDWPLSALETRYGEILQAQTQDESRLQLQIENYSENSKASKKALGKYKNIPPADIEAVCYDEARLEFLEDEEQQSEKRLEDKKREREEARVEHAKAETTFGTCKRRLTEEGWTEPLSLNEIKRDYDNRLSIISRNLSAIAAESTRLDEERETCNDNIRRISQTIKVAAYTNIPAPEGGWGSVDIGTQSSQLEQIRNGTDKLRKSLTEASGDIKSKFAGKHGGIDNLLESLHLDRCDFTYSAYYSASLRLTEQCTLLQENVRVLNTFLERLDDQRENVVYHAFAHGKRLHSELKKLSESSRVKLVPDKPKQQTLKIGVPDELDQLAEERIRNHVEACITELRRLRNENELNDKTLRSVVGARLDNREILNQTIGRNSIDVRLLKVDILQSNTKLRAWESGLTDNSGGELFVSCFALLSALMDYARCSVSDDGAKNEGSAKVMVIDNPFGATSSDHLLDALIQVAQRFNMQLICLSDLSQSSITGKFSLIYQLSVRPALYSNKAYLKTDSVAANVSLQRDNRLDYVSLKHEQLSLA